MWDWIGLQEGHADNHGQAVTSSPRVDQFSVVPPGIVVLAHLVILNDLVILELDYRRVEVAVTVILGEDGERLVRSISLSTSWFAPIRIWDYFIEADLPVVVDQPPWALGHEQDASKNNSGNPSLDNGRGPPRP